MAGRGEHRALPPPGEDDRREPLQIGPRSHGVVDPRVGQAVEGGQVGREILAEGRHPVSWAPLGAAAELLPQEAEGAVHRHGQPPRHRGGGRAVQQQERRPDGPRPPPPPRRGPAPPPPRTPPPPAAGRRAPGSGAASAASRGGRRRDGRNPGGSGGRDTPRRSPAPAPRPRSAEAPARPPRDGNAPGYRRRYRPDRARAAAGA